jgi:hypothetical protein
MRRLSLFSLIAAGTVGAPPLEVLGQSEASLVRFVVESAITEALEVEDLQPVVCIAVKGLADREARDARSEERPTEAPTGISLAGASDCSEHRLGATHTGTGRQAVIYKIGVGELADDQATYTFGWFRTGLNAGASECNATWGAGGWTRGKCRPLWIS